MNLRELQVFCDVVATRSVSQAAARNGISQSAVTQLLDRLEERLGTQLLDRGRRPLGVTPAGERCVRCYREILDRCAGLEHAFQGLPQDGARAVVIRLAAVSTAGLALLARLREEFRERHPQARVELQIVDAEQVYDRVHQNQADIGIVAHPVESGLVRVIPLRQEPMVVVCHPRHPFEHAECLSVADLAGEPFVVCCSPCVAWQSTREYLARHGVVLTPVEEYADVEAVKQTIVLGRGVTILPAPTVYPEVARGSLTIAPLSLALYRPLGILLPVGRPRSREVEAFVALLRAAA